MILFFMVYLILSVSLYSSNSSYSLFLFLYTYIYAFVVFFGMRYWILDNGSHWLKIFKIFHSFHGEIWFFSSLFYSLPIFRPTYIFLDSCTLFFYTYILFLYFLGYWIVDEDRDSKFSRFFYSFCRKMDVEKYLIEYENAWRF